MSCPVRVATVLGPALAFVTASTAAAQTTRSTTDLYRVGNAADDSVYFTKITSAAADSRGRLFITDYGDNRVRYFSLADGTYLGSLGREGDGPGEFRGLRHVSVVHDSVVVSDRALQRLTVFTPALTFARTWSLDRTTRTGAGPYSTPETLIPGGGHLAVTFPAARLDGQSGVQQLPIVSVAPAGRARTIAVRRVAHVEMLIRPAAGADPVASARQPFAEEDLVAICPGGASLLVVRVLDKRHYEVRRVATVDGRTLYARRLAFRGRPPTRQVVDSIIGFWSEVLGKGPLAGQSSGRRRAIVRSALYVPDMVAPVSAVVCDAAGAAWLRLTEPPGQQAYWQRLSAGGAALDAVQLPADFQLLGYWQGIVVGTQQDELDVGYLVARRIR